MDGKEMVGKALIVMKLKQLVREAYVTGALNYCRKEALSREDVDDVETTEVWEEIKDLEEDWLR